MSLSRLTLLLIGALAVAGPTSAAAPCDVQFSRGLVITGSPGRQNLVIAFDFDQSRTFVWLDCNGDGDYLDTTLGDRSTEYFFNPSNSLLDTNIQLKGNDTIVIRTVGVGTWTSAYRRFDLFLGGGTNSVTFRSGSVSLTAGTQLLLSIVGGTGKDDVRVDLDSSPLSASSLVLRADLGAGNDTLNLSLPPVLSGSVFEAAVDLGLGQNTVDLNLRNDVALGGDATIDVEGGTGIDIVRARLAGEFPGQLRLNAELGGGNNRFEGSVDAATWQVGLGGFVGLSAAAGAGSDTLEFRSDEGLAVPLEGTFDLRFNSGAGNDVVGIDLSSGGFANMSGRLNLRADGGAGNDNVSLAVDGVTPAANTGTYDVAVTGGPGTDTLSAFFNTEGPGAVLYGPARVVLVDGGFGSGDACLVAGTAGSNLYERSCEL